jgi:uncharacterized protein
MTSFSHLRHQLAISALALLFACCFARGNELPPAPKHFFNDYAGVVSESTRRELNARLEKFHKDTSNQVVVAIFPHMDSTLSLEDYTLRVANAWGIGQSGKDNGIILFVFLRDRSMRIEVGYGLTSVLTDALSKQILEQDLTPHFQKKDFDGGFEAGVGSILKIVGEHWSRSRCIKDSESSTRGFEGNE